MTGVHRHGYSDHNRVRDKLDRGHRQVDRYLTNLDKRPAAEVSETAQEEKSRGFSQKILEMEMSAEMMKKVWSRPEVRGMRRTFPMSVMGLITVLRVLTGDLHDKVMNGDGPVEKGSIFEAIVQRFGDSDEYQAPPKMKNPHS